ncbi:unnamed protein product [Cuscuta campestris]|uniref:Uncharacterized protein n=1 Tax=Cuscuta campestris TaxID=132261 RepID=A0A484M376_9ASTE|nr:unnamed protein product [Cuscuta campestris]
MTEPFPEGIESEEMQGWQVIRIGVLQWLPCGMPNVKLTVKPLKFIYDTFDMLLFKKSHYLLLLFRFPDSRRCVSDVQISCMYVGLFIFDFGRWDETTISKIPPR